MTTSGLTSSYYTTVITNPNQNLQPGDILNNPGAHVVTVYTLEGRDQFGRLRIRVIDSCGGNDKVDIHDPELLEDRIRDGYTARELVWHGN